VSFFPGADTLFKGQQINVQTQRGETPRQIEEETEQRQTGTERREEKRREEQRREEKRRDRDRREETEKRVTEERSKTQIKEDPSSRSKEKPGPLRDTTSEGPSTL
jgi:hypothetical protein